MALHFINILSTIPPGFKSKLFLITAKAKINASKCEFFYLKIAFKFLFELKRRELKFVKSSKRSEIEQRKNILVSTDITKIIHKNVFCSWWNYEITYLKITFEGSFIKMNWTYVKIWILWKWWFTTNIMQPFLS